MLNLLHLQSIRNGSVAPASERAAEVSDAAFEALVDAQYRRIYNLAYRMVGNESDAADLTQETFVRAYRALPRLRAEGALGIWLRRIATNLCLDFLRRRKHTFSTASLDTPFAEESDTSLAHDIADPGGEPDRQFASQERLQILHRAINTLPEDYRAIVLLHHIEEMHVEEIARTLGIPCGTVKSRLSRARRALRYKLSPYFDPDLASSP